MGTNTEKILLEHIKGTPGFIAPEIMQNQEYSVKSDVFAVGCTMFFLLCNEYAVLQSDGMDLEDMMPDNNRLRSLLQAENEQNRDDESKIDRETIDFVLLCLSRDPTKRPTADEALKNKIFQS